MPTIDAVSRRRFLLGGAASLSLAPLAASAQSASEDPGIATAQDLENRLTVEVRLGGKGPFRFVVDTGADRTVIADDVAGELGLARGNTVSVLGIARTIDAQTARLDDLEFGRENIGRLDAPVLPRRWLGADGYLGLDAIDGRRVAFDFRHHALAITEPRSVQLLNMIKPDETVVPAGGKSGRLRSINCHVDGVRAYAFIDSGAGVSVGNSALLNELLRRSPAYATAQTAQLTGVTGGSVTGRVTSVDRVRLGGLDFSDAGLVICDLQIFELWGLASRPALFIGMDLLRQFSQVTVDYGRKEYRFEFASLAVASLT